MTRQLMRLIRLLQWKLQRQYLLPRVLKKECSRLLPLQPSVSLFWTLQKCKSGSSTSVHPFHAEPLPSPYVQPEKTDTRGAIIFVVLLFMCKTTKTITDLCLWVFFFYILDSLWSLWPGHLEASCSLWWWFLCLSWIQPAHPGQHPAVSAGCLSPSPGYLMPPAADCNDPTLSSADEMSHQLIKRNCVFLFLLVWNFSVLKINTNSESNVLTLTSCPYLWLWVSHLQGSFPVERIMLH